MFELLDIPSDWLFTLGSFAGGGALGGLISSIINRRENRRIKQSEASQSEASAKREDALAATEMMGLLERTVAHMEKMNSYNKSNSEELLRMLKEKESINEKLKKDIALLQLQITEDHRRITGLEKRWRGRSAGARMVTITIAWWKIVKTGYHLVVHSNELMNNHKSKEYSK